MCAAHLSSVAEAKRKGEEEVKRKAAEKALLQAAKDGDTHKCTDEAGAATAHRKPDALASNGSLVSTVSFNLVLARTDKKGS